MIEDPRVDDRESTQDLIYVVDSNLDLVSANQAWWAFAEENTGEALLRSGQQINALESMSGSHRERWRALYNALLAGQLPAYEESFSCPSPTLRRQYTLSIQPVLSPSGDVEYLRHRARHVSEKPIKGHASPLKPRTEKPDSDVSVRKEPIRIATLCRPLEGDGGDLVWTWHESDTRKWWLIAYAMGHDENATGAVRRMRDLVEANLGDSPETVVEAVNHQFLQTRQQCPEGRPLFVMGALCLIDLNRHQVRVCGFGHDVLMTTNSGVMKIDGGMPVGILSDAGPWHEEVLDTETIGKRGMACTDGLVEQFNNQEAMYTAERLFKTFLETREAPLSGLTFCTQQTTLSKKHRRPLP